MDVLCSFLGGADPCVNGHDIILAKDHGDRGAPSGDYPTRQAARMPHLSHYHLSLTSSSGILTRGNSRDDIDAPSNEEG